MQHKNLALRQNQRNYKCKIKEIKVLYMKSEIKRKDLHQCRPFNMQCNKFIYKKKAFIVETLIYPSVQAFNNNIQQSCIH